MKGTASPASPESKIITFYSYKGGTGRSMALANVAWILAANRKRVLALDWDLEAPGLHRYFRPFLIDKYLTSSEGLIDFVINFADQVITPPASGEQPPADWYVPYADLTRYALSVNFAEFPSPGKIDLIPAGRQGVTYATRVNSFNWQNFYDRLGGGAFLEAVKGHMRRNYDYILIDSRTGVSDTAGICTIQMPDVLAICFTYNNQSMEGAAAVARSSIQGRRKILDATDDGTFKIFPIPTRVEQAEQGKLSARQKYAHSLFGDLLANDVDLDSYWSSVEVPYVPYHGYEEILAAFTDDPNDPKKLLYSLVNLTGYLTGTAVKLNFPVSQEVKNEVLRAFAETPGAGDAQQNAPTTETETAAQEVVRLAEAHFLFLPPEQQEEGKRVWTRLVRVVRPEDGVGHAKQRVNMREFGGAAPLVRALVQAGLLSLDQDRAGGRETVEITNELLIRHWSRLQEWLRKDLDFLIWRQRLREQVQDWENNEYKSDFLLRGEPLRMAKQWLGGHRADLNQAEQDFINRSSLTELVPSFQPIRGAGRTFIIRPFGTQNGINFEDVERVLIAPALKAIGAEGGTTIDIVKAGNIRVDMFRRLLTADLVIADLSIHNATVFYELGIRHALRNHGTFMLRCDADKFPFDLQTDRYFDYDKNDPAASLDKLITALQRTMEEIERDATAKDSPVFTSLPNLREPDFSLFNPVPQDFGEEVARATANSQPGDLALLSYEVKGFEWETRGWRTVGTAQIDLNALVGAKVTWENVRKLEPDELEANIWLGTIYERLGDLTRSTQALERALANKALTQNERAEEVYSLLGRNFKTRWRGEWESSPSEERAVTALRSPHLQDSFENYERAFDEDLRHYYSGLNALVMIKVMIALAEARPEVWAENFTTDKKAEEALDEHREHAAKLVAAVELSLKALFRRLEREGKRDVWAEISAADLLCITTDAPRRVAAAYRRTLAAAPDFASGAVRRQLAIYRDLGVLGANLAEVFKVVGEPPPLPAPGGEPTAAPRRQRVLLFAGHMIDAPDRAKPRFPADKELVARAWIKEVVVKEMNTGAGVLSGYAGGASGGDILFHEVCAELGIPTRLYLAIPPQKYVTTSVQQARAQWVERFWRLYNEHQAQKQVRVLSDATDEGEYLPAWLREKPDYSIWQRNNLWMLFNALNEGCDPKTEDPNITLIALWDGEGGHGPGGPGDLVKKVEDLGARSEIIKTKELFGL